MLFLSLPDLGSPSQGSCFCAIWCFSLRRFYVISLAPVAMIVDHQTMLSVMNLIRMINYGKKMYKARVFGNHGGGDRLRRRRSKDVSGST